MLGVRGDGVERAVGADVLRLVDVERDRPGRRALARDQRLDLEIFAGEHFEIVQRARHDGADDHRVDVGLGIAFELEQLVQPDGILVGGPPRVGRDPPARLDLAPVDQREDEVGVAGVDGEQHGRALAAHAVVHNSTSPARTISTPRRGAGAARRRARGRRTCRRPSPSVEWTVSARADRMRAREPGAGEAVGIAAAPQGEQAREAGGEQGREGLRATARRSATPRPGPSDRGAVARLTPNPTTTRSPLRSSRMPASFALPSSRSFGHLSISGWPGTATSTASISASPAASDSVGAGGIARLQLDQRAAEEIAGFADPRRALAAPARRPAPARPASRLRRRRRRQAVGVGRAGALDDADAAQKSDPAARSVSAAERADQQIAERRDDQRGEQDQRALDRLA